MRFYDVTSWSYVNLDDPIYEFGLVGKPDQSNFVSAGPG